jgi:hypothetical protein
MGPCHRSPTALRFHRSHRLPYKRICHNLANSAKLQWAPGPHHHHCHHHLTSQILDGAAPRTKRTSLDLSSKSTHFNAWNFPFFRPILGLVSLGFSIILPPFYPSFRKELLDIPVLLCSSPHTQGSRLSLQPPRVLPNYRFSDHPPCRSLIYPLFAWLPLVSAVSRRFGSILKYPSCSIHSIRCAKVAVCH